MLYCWEEVKISYIIKRNRMDEEEFAIHHEEIQEMLFFIKETYSGKSTDEVKRAEERISNIIENHPSFIIQMFDLIHATANNESIHPLIQCTSNKQSPMSSKSSTIRSQINPKYAKKIMFLLAISTCWPLNRRTWGSRKWWALLWNTFSIKTTKWSTRMK